MKKIGVALALVLVLLLVTVSVASAIWNGEPDQGRHPYVGMAQWAPERYCSGFAVSPTIFVTAAHCYRGWAGEQVWVSFDEEPWETGGWVQGTPHPHPEFCMGCRPGWANVNTHDIAVVVLDPAVSLPEYPNLPELNFVDTLQMNTPVSIIGYGFQWQMSGGPPYWEGTGTRHLAWTELITNRNAWSDEYITLRANPSQGTGGIWIHDSGGPNILEGDGQGNDIALAITTHMSGTHGVIYSNRLDLDYALEFIQRFLGGS